MKKSLGRTLADMCLEDEDDHWEEEENYAGTDVYEDASRGESSANVNANEANPDVDVGEVCAVCLNPIELEDLAIVKGCEHEYCVHCILQWAMCKEAPWCPQCKKPFNYLYCHRLLDGTLSDVPVEESVCLLKRASWFVEHVKTLEKGKAVSAAMAAEEVPAEWADPYQYYEDEDDDYDEDEQIEKYYFSSAAGRARVVLGNRRLGENGYMRAGRMYARPANGNSASQASGSVGGGIGKAGKGRAGPNKATPHGDYDVAGADGSGAEASGSGGGGSSSNQRAPSGASARLSAAASAAVGPSPGVKGQGRRAKRNARRAAADMEAI